MTDKRYQVFVSSTFADLQEERQEVMHALLELDCIPSGMELFPAANETQWSLIQRVIEDCDYYILIVGGRYGSVAPDGISYTEKEFHYALSLNKPTIAFLHRDPGKIVADKTESSEEGRRKLAEFRGLVEKKLCKHWDTPQELGSVVSRSLIHLIKTAPAVGWIRANELATTEATQELLRLRREVEELHKELIQTRTTAPSGSENLAQGNEIHTVAYTVKASPEFGFENLEYEGTTTATWNEYFSVVAPLMIHETTENSLSTALNDWLSHKESSKHKHKDYKSPTFKMHHDDFQTIKIQLRALGLIKKSEKPRSVKDTGTYWSLTPYGDETMTRLRAIKRGSSRLSITLSET